MRTWARPNRFFPVDPFEDRQQPKAGKQGQVRHPNPAYRQLSKLHLLSRAMAASASSSTAASSTTSFARLLKASKVISQYDPAIPLVYTTHGGSHKRSDFGLKRALPRTRTPAIRVSHLDHPRTKLTDFEYASREHKFVRRWREAGIGITGGQSNDTDEARAVRQVAERPGGCGWDRSSFDSVEALREIARTGRRRAPKRQPTGHEYDFQEQRHRNVHEALTSNPSDAANSASSAAAAAPPSTMAPTFSPDYVNMSEADFRRFLARLRSLKSKYQEHVLKTTQADFQLRGAQESVNAVALRQFDRAREDPWPLIDSFLRQEFGSELPHDPILDNLHPLPHRSLGLSYAPPTLYQQDVAGRTLPARALLTAGATGGRGATTSVMGLVTETSRQDLPSSANTGRNDLFVATTFEPDEDGYLNPQYGKFKAVVAKATLSLGTEHAFSSASAADPVQTYGPTNPNEKQTTILDEAPIQISVYKATDDTFTRFRDLQNARIGSQEWVATDFTSRSSGTKAPHEFVSWFTPPDAWKGQSRLAPPKVDQFTYPDRIKRRKAQQERAEAARSAKPGHMRAADNDSAALSELIGESGTSSRWLRECDGTSIVTLADCESLVVFTNRSPSIHGSQVAWRRELVALYNILYIG